LSDGETSSTDPVRSDGGDSSGLVESVTSPTTTTLPAARSLTSVDHRAMTASVSPTPPPLEGPRRSEVPPASSEPSAALASTAPTDDPASLRPQHARRRRNHRIILWSTVGLVVVVLASAGLVADRRIENPLPQPTAAGGRLSSSVVPGSSPAPPWPMSGQAAVAIPALGYAEQSGPEQPVPIASLTKMTTAVVVLRDHPVPLGSNGPTITITADEAAQFGVDLDNDETNIPLSTGEQISELQLLEALFVQSANDAAYTLAEWDAGSQQAFVAKMNALASSLGAVHSHYVDASGFDPRSVSTAADTLRIAAAGMAIPTFAHVAGMPRADLQGVGMVNNIVTKIGSDGIIGVKSGYTSQASGCMVLAGMRFLGGRSVLVLASALGQLEPAPPPPPSPPPATSSATPTSTTVPVATTSTATTQPYNPIEAQFPLLYTEPIVERLLDASEATIVPVLVATAGHTVSTVSTRWGGTRRVLSLVAGHTAWLLGIPGQHVDATLTPVAPTGTRVGSASSGAVRYTLGSQTEKVPVRLVHRLSDPGWWWKVLNN
jgi:serine-type D-Ala-D-Ala carboxypeptidase (penicillin-binding protein 5/6)